MITFKKKNFPFYPQHDSMDCGPACLRMIASYIGRQYSSQDLRNRSYIDKEGVSLQDISEAVESIGYRTMGVKNPYADKADQPSLVVASLTVIVHWNQNHFVVVYRISNKYVWVADPGSEKHKLTVEDFNKHLISDYDLGIAFLLETTAKFADNEIGGGKNVSSFIISRSNFKSHKKIYHLQGAYIRSVISHSFHYLIEPSYHYHPWPILSFRENKKLIYEPT